MFGYLPLGNCEKNGRKKKRCRCRSGKVLYFNSRLYMKIYLYETCAREQQTQMKVLESRLERASTRLESLSQQRKGMTTRDLIERTDEELKTAKYRKEELLPKKLADQKRQLTALKEAAADSNPDRIELLEKDEYHA